MSTYLYCRVVETSKGRALVPDDRKSFDLLSQVKVGRPVMVKTKTARNPKQHRLLWALAAKIAENVERFQDAEHVVHELKIQTGHVERRQINVPGLGIVFQEWPREMLVTSRLIRYINGESGWRRDLAQGICDALLDIFDPTGSHCKERKQNG